MKMEWLLCPLCGSKTRNKIREDTVLKNYPLYCPKCKQEVLVEGYIAKLCACTLKDDAGNTYSYVGEEMKNRLQVLLITRTLVAEFMA